MEKQNNNAHWLLTGSSGFVGLAASLGITSEKALYILCLLVMAQLISGICVAVLENTPTRNQKILKLCMHKVMVAFIVAIAYFLNDFIPSQTDVFSNLVIWFYVTEEGLSFLQNMN